MTRNWVWVLGAVCASALINACKTDVTVTAPSSAVAIDSSGNNGTGTGNTGTPSFVITPSGGNLTVNVGQTITVSSCKDASGNAATCTGSSITSNSSSITVSGLTITCTAVGATGTITVTTSVNGTQVSRTSNTFTCVAASSNGSISFSPSSGSYAVGTSTTLTATCTIVSCASATWSSSNTAVATVTPTGPTATLACISAGTATITVTSGGQTFSGTFTCTNTSLVANPSSISVQNCSGFISTYTPVVTLSGTSTQVSVTWSSSNTGIVTTNGSSFTLTGNVGNATLTGITSTGATVQVPVTVTQCQSGTNTASPSSISVTNCSGFQTSYNLQFLLNGVTQSGATWSSNNTNVATVSGSTLTLSSTNTGTATITGTLNGQTVTIPVTINACSTGGTLTVQPNPLNITLGSIGTLTAIPNGVSGSVTWTSTTGCTFFTGQNGMSVNVQGYRVCRDSVVGQISNVKGWTIVNVTSAATTSCIISGSQTVGLGLTTGLSADCGTNQPWWFSHDPSRVSVVGAPYVCVYGGIAWPCGPTATIKGVAAGTTDVCAQPGVTDTTHAGCQPETVPAGSSGDIIPNDGPLAIELKLPDHAPPRGMKPADIHIYTWAQYVELRKSGAIKP